MANPPPSFDSFPGDAADDFLAGIVEEHQRAKPEAKPASKPSAIVQAKEHARRIHRRAERSMHGGHVDLFKEGGRNRHSTRERHSTKRHSAGEEGQRPEHRDNLSERTRERRREADRTYDAERGRREGYAHRADDSMRHMRDEMSTANLSLSTTHPKRSSRTSASDSGATHTLSRSKRARRDVSDSSGRISNKDAPDYLLDVSPDDELLIHSKSDVLYKRWTECVLGSEVRLRQAGKDRVVATVRESRPVSRYMDAGQVPVSVEVIIPTEYVANMLADGHSADFVALPPDENSILDSLEHEDGQNYRSIHGPVRSTDLYASEGPDVAGPGIPAVRIALDRHVRDHPDDIRKWIELAELEDSSNIAGLDIRLAVIEKGLSHNPESPELWRAFFATAGRFWPKEQLAEKWTSVLRHSQSVALRMQHFLWLQTTGSFETMEAAFMSIRKLNLTDKEKCNLILAYASYLWDAGYSERSLALFVHELNIVCASDNTPYSHNYDMAMDPFTEWARLESQNNYIQSPDLREFDALSQDPYRIVLKSEHYPLTIENRSMLVGYFLLFLGKQADVALDTLYDSLKATFSRPDESMIISLLRSMAHHSGPDSLELSLNLLSQLLDHPSAKLSYVLFSADDPRFVKRMLATRRDDVSLWTAYAILEDAHGNVNIARKVFENILQNAQHFNTQDILAMRRFYCILEMSHEVEFRKQQFQKPTHGKTEDDQTRNNPSTSENATEQENKETQSRTLPTDRIVSIAAGGDTPSHILRARNRYATELEKLFFMGPNSAETRVNTAILYAVLEYTTRGFDAMSLVYEKCINFIRAQKLENTDEFCRLAEMYSTMWLSHRIQTRGAYDSAALRRLLEEALGFHPTSEVLVECYLMNEAPFKLENRVGNLFAALLRDHHDKVAVWQLAIAAEKQLGHTQRAEELFDHAVEALPENSGLWKAYVEHFTGVGKEGRAKAVLLRALGACPWVKDLYLLAFTTLRHQFSNTDLKNLYHAILEHGLRVRIDIHTIVPDRIFDGPSQDDENNSTTSNDEANELEQMIHSQLDAMPF